MAPKSAGSSTMGVKKSTVATRARSGAIRYTAASSRDDADVSTLGSTIGGRAPSTCPSSTGLSLQAQPAPWLYSVNRKGESMRLSIATVAIGPDSPLTAGALRARAELPTWWGAQINRDI